MLLEQAVDQFLVYFLSTGNSPATCNLYQNTLKQMVKYLENCRLDQVTGDNLGEWFEALGEEQIGRDLRHRAPGTMRAYWSAMRSFFRWGEMLGYICERPDVTIDCPSGDDDIVIPIKRHEFLAMLDAVDRAPESLESLLGRAVLMVLMDTGIRAGELCRLSIKDINICNRTVYIRAHNISGRKTKPRYIPITSHTLSSLLRYLKRRGKTHPSDALFQSSGGGQFTRYSVRHLLFRIGKDGGVKGVTPHRFRHAFATEFLRNNGYDRIDELRHFLGHVTDEVVMRYLELSRSDARASHARGSIVANGFRR